MILIELYAFVTRSYRIGSRQYFSFSDLFFPFQPPYITGYWECWESNSHYNETGKAFLGPGGKEWQRARFPNGKAIDNDSHAQDHPPALDEEPAGRMCRVIGTLTTNKSFSSRRPPKQTVSGVDTIALKVLSIISATWQDVEYVKGIVQP